MLVYNPITIGTTNNKVYFNDDTQDPYMRIKSWTFTKRQIEEFDIKLPETSGIADFQSYLGKETVLIGGTMYPSAEAAYSTGEQALRKLASLDIEQADAGSDAGYVPVAIQDDDGINKQFFAKFLYVDLPKTPRKGLKLDYTLVGKVKNPVLSAQTATSMTIGSSTATTSGSSNLPFTLPHAMGLTTYSSNGTITNAGPLPTYPSITITGPVTTPRITNSTTGEYIELGITLTTTSDTAIITYDQDTLSITQAGNSVLNTLTSGSTLFKLRSGTNTLTLTGATVGSGANATVSINSAWPLS